MAPDNDKHRDAGDKPPPQCWFCHSRVPRAAPTPWSVELLRSLDWWAVSSKPFTVCRISLHQPCSFPSVFPFIFLLFSFFTVLSLHAWSFFYLLSKTLKQKDNYRKIRAVTRGQWTVTLVTSDFRSVKKLLHFLSMPQRRPWLHLPLLHFQDYTQIYCQSIHFRGRIHLYYD